MLDCVWGLTVSMGLYWACCCEVGGLLRSYCLVFDLRWVFVVVFHECYWIVGLLCGFVLVILGCSCYTFGFDCG